MPCTRGRDSSCPDVWVLEREAREPVHGGGTVPWRGTERVGAVMMSRCIVPGEGRAGERARQGTPVARCERGPETWLGEVSGAGAERGEPAALSSPHARKIGRRRLPL